MKQVGLRLRLAVLATATWAVGSVCAAPDVQTVGPFTVSFYNQGDSNGYLTGEQDWAPDHKARVADAIAAWDAGILNTPARPVDMHLFWLDLPENVLGGSASVQASDGETIWQLGEYVWKEGKSIDSSYGFDTIIQYDIAAAGFAWNFSSALPGGGEIDFQTVVSHEIGHSLGFVSSYDAPYDDFGWFDGYGYAGLTSWDKLLIDQEGNKPVSGPEHDFNVTNNPVYWEGTAANVLYGGSVPIYAPAEWQQGSSLSHVDPDGLPGGLMKPFIALGETVRVPTDVEWAMMQDMGWQIIPEPQTLLLGLLILLGGRRLRRRTPLLTSEQHEKSVASA